MENIRYEERRRQAGSEVSRLSGLLDAMENSLETNAFRDRSEDFKKTLAECRAVFKPDRDRLWARYEELWSRRKAWMSQRSVESEAAKSQYVNDLFSLDYKYDGLPFAQTFSNWERVGHKVRAARERLKAMQNAARKDPCLLPKDRKAVFDEIQNVWFKVKQAEETTFSVHGERAEQLYNEAHRAVENLRPGEAAAVLKANGAELRSLWLSSHDREKYRRWFDELWERLRLRREAAQAEWRGRQKEGLDRLTQARDRLHAALERVQDNNRTNRSRLSDARSEDYRERVSEWLREGEEREREMERSLEELEAKIRHARDRLG